MNLTIPDDALAGVSLTPDQARLELAVRLFEDGRVTVARGAKIAGLAHLEFQQELGRRRIPMHYGIDDYEHDLATLSAAESR